MQASKEELTQLLWKATAGGTPKIIERLIDLGADPKAKDDEGEDALMRAAAEGDEKCLAALIRHSDATAKAENGRGETALMIAANFGHAACVALLIPVSNPNATDAHGWTALMHAVSDDQPECARLLMPVSDAKQEDAQGRTALFHAALGRGECLKLLLPVSDPLVRDETGQTALMAALGHMVGADEYEENPDFWRPLLPLSDLDAMDFDKICVSDVAEAIQGETGRQIQGLIAAERDRRALAAEVKKTGETARKNQNNQEMEVLAKKPPRL